MDEVAGSIPVTSTNFELKLYTLQWESVPMKSGRPQVRSLSRPPNSNSIVSTSKWRASTFKSLRKRAPSFCHSERSEESLFLFLVSNRREIPRFARNDKIGHIFRRLLSQITCLRFPEAKQFIPELWQRSWRARHLPRCK